MASSSTSDDEGAFPTAFATSILGLKTPLRFRPHGITQKPHIILRRVVDTETSEDTSDAKSVVRFSLFAVKRIDVKPGKEILLCVATEDDRFKDIPLVFESDLNPSTSGPNVLSPEEQKEGQVNGPPGRHAVPAKMRRVWTKKNGKIPTFTSRSLI